MVFLTILLAVSCTKEGQDSFVEVTVDYSVAVGEQTKAYGEGDEVTHIWYALYRKSNDKFVRSFTPAPMVNGVATCPVTLVLNQEYKLVFVGMNYEYKDGQLTPAYIIQKEHATISMPTNSVANSEKLDCFYGYDEIQVNQPETGTSITLSRITSQVNFLCKAESWQDEYASATSSMTLSGVARNFKLLEGQLSGSQDVEYTATSLLTGEKLQEDGDYRICSVYTFAADGVSAECKFNHNHNGVTETFTVSELPLATNKRTNVYVK